MALLKFKCIGTSKKCMGGHFVIKCVVTFVIKSVGTFGIKCGGTFGIKCLGHFRKIREGTFIINNMVVISS